MSRMLCAPGRGDFKCPLHVMLALDFPEIQIELRPREKLGQGK